MVKYTLKIIQPTGSIILAQIKKFKQIIKTQRKDGPGYLIKSTSAIFNCAHVETGYFHIFTRSIFLTKSYGMWNA